MEKFSAAMPDLDTPSLVSMASEAEPEQQEEHENMKNLLISSSSSLSADTRGLRRSRAVRSKKQAAALGSDRSTAVLRSSVAAASKWMIKTKKIRFNSHFQIHVFNKILEGIFHLELQIISV